MQGGLKFTTYPNPARVGSPRGACCGKLVHSQIMGVEEMAEEIAKAHRIDVMDARYYCNLISAYAADALCEGKRLDFGDFSLSLTIKGTFKAANSNYDPEKNSLGVVATPSPRLRQRLAELRPENAGDIKRPVFKSILCKGMKPLQEKTIRLGGNVMISGDNFLVDVLRDDEGIWLADVKTGARLAKGEVAQSTRTTMNCTFPADAGLAPGEYRLVLYTRSGEADAASPSSTSVRIKLVR